MAALIGDIPPGWYEAPLDQLCELRSGPSGASLRAEERTTTGVPVVLPRNIRDRRVEGHDLQRVPDDVAGQLSRYTLAEADIVCTRTGQPGRVGLIEDEQAGWLFSTGLLRIRVRDRAAIRADYLLNYLDLPQVQDWMERHSHSTTAVRHLSMRVLGTLPVPIPPLDVQQKTAAVLSALDAKAAVHREISMVTGRLRDTLAPFLLTGARPPIGMP